MCVGRISSPKKTANNPGQLDIAQFVNLFLGRVDPWSLHNPFFVLVSWRQYLPCDQGAGNRVPPSKQRFVVEITQET